MFERDLTVNLPFLTNIQKMSLTCSSDSPGDEIELSHLTNLTNLQLFRTKRVSLPTSLVTLKFMWVHNQNLPQLKKIPKLRKFYINGSLKCEEVVDVISNITSLTNVLIKNMTSSTPLFRLTSLRNLTKLSVPHETISLELVESFPKLKIIEHGSQKIGMQHLGILEIEKF